MQLGLSRRVALVTGGSQGIGRAVALQLAAEGVRVALTFHSERARAEQLVREIEQAGGEALAIEMDLASLDSVRAAVAVARERFGSVDILVNNAVRWSDKLPWEAPRFEDVAEAEWQGIVHANVDGAIAAIQAVLPGMRGRGWGRIVSVSSGVALDGVVGAAAYGAAKAAFHGLTACLAREVGPHGVLINVVVPGFTVTEKMSALTTPEVREQRGKAYPVGRLLPPEEVAPTIVFLCSAANTAVTGEVVRASGGRP
ncbi:SDR family NAD(P)-dependent oxidoreductase [Nannocystis punicea]|uniref:SDR family oxidoreductase n=1 Tax=Nannocystis punicea TaxID=2995304 RepID=A0ABY7GST1_9BACT|nr:SDR family NAD(P)-dependent oxidoreductase [Nannocystis poenicansa]WAS90010.1 SDR family oxidoreductase [Nannocystis poenicansa]